MNAWYFMQLATVQVTLNIKRYKASVHSCARVQRLGDAAGPKTAVSVKTLQLTNVGPLHLGTETGALGGWFFLQR